MKRFFVIGLLLLLAMAACHSPQREARPCPQEDILYQLTFYSATKPDSVMHILDTLNVDVLSEKERAHYCLLKVGVRDMFFMYDDETDSLLQVAENYFIGSKEKYFESETYEALSRIAFKKGQGEQTKLEWLQKALQSIGKCQHIDERFIRFSVKPTTEQEMIDIKKYRLHMKLGMCYLDNDYNEASLPHLKEAERYFAKTTYADMHFQTANMLGNAYLALKEYDSCLFWYRKGMEAAQNAGNAEQIAYCYLSMSMYYRYRFEYQDYESEEEGEQLLRNSIAECQKGLALYEGSMFRFKDGLYNDLTKSYFQLQQYDSCLYYSEKILAFYEKYHFDMVPNAWNAGIYKRMYQSHEALGHTEEALEYARLYFEMQQAIEDQPKAVEQVKNEYDKKLEMMQLQTEQQMKHYRLYLMLALTLVVLLLVLWLTFRYRKNKEIEALKFKEANRQLQSDLEQVTQHSQQVLQQRAMKLYKTEGDKALERILAEFETAYPQAMDNLKTAYPELTDTERNIVILSFVGFRMKEEADILHLSLNTVEKYRSNIRKKAGSNPISHLIR